MQNMETLLTPPGLSQPGRPHRKAGQGAQFWDDRRSQGQW